MTRALRIAGIVVVALLAIAATAAAYVAWRGIPKYEPVNVTLDVAVTPERVARGRKWAGLLCVGCHRDPVSGQLTGKHMSDAPPEFGPIYAKNITRHPTKGIGSWTDGELAVLLRTGLAPDGQYVPPPMPKLPHLADEDLYSIIAFLKSDDPLVAPAAVDPPGVSEPSLLTKALTYVAFRPLPYPTAPIVAPPAADRVARGRYLAFALDCYACHSASFLTMNIEEPEKSDGYMGGGNTLIDLRGRPIQSANITPDEATGIGRWSEAQFLRALKQGFRPDNKPIRYPMVPLVELEDADASAIYAYLRTIPAISRSVPREEAADQANVGKNVYEKYGCASCHGDDGVGIADLRGSREHFPSDQELENWIRHAPQIRPETKMPAFEGIIAENEYSPLVQYVRQLGQ